MLTAPIHLAFFRRDLMGGGAERVIVNLARRFAEEGAKVDLVLSRAEGPLLESVPENVRIVDLNASQFDRNTVFKLPTSFSSLSSLPKLISYLRGQQPDALIAASHFSNEVAIAAKLLARTPTRVVVSEHIALSIQAEKVEQVSSRLAPAASRLLYPRADAIVAVSRGVAEDLAEVIGLSPERIETIYNPVIVPELLEKSKAPLDHPWFAPGEPPIILGTGRLVEQKDFPTLLRAFERVRRQISCRLMILGRGREEKNLRQLIAALHLEDEVALIGFVDNPFAYMARASVFVLSSAWEGFGNVLVEAMAVGTPVVSTDCESGPAEILDGGRYGELVPVGDVERMAEAILRVLSEGGKVIPPDWLEQFTIESATERYAALIENLGIGNGNRRDPALLPR
jgi:glycosyltransferase involved in cell wall biosynthesis